MKSLFPQQALATLALRTHIRSGNLRSDGCYVKRNLCSLECGLAGWPQKDGTKVNCAGNNNENRLKECLFASGEPDWWKAFPECNSSQQCFDTRPAWITVE